MAMRILQIGETGVLVSVGASSYSLLSVTTRTLASGNKLGPVESACQEIYHRSTGDTAFPSFALAAVRQEIWSQNSNYDPATVRLPNTIYLWLV